MVKCKNNGLTSSCYMYSLSWADPDGGKGVQNHKTIGLLINTGPDPMEITKLQCTKSAFNVGPSSASQRNAMSGGR